MKLIWRSLLPLRAVTFVTDTDPYADELEPSCDDPDTLPPTRLTSWNSNGAYQTSPIETPKHGLEALSAVATRDTYSLLQHQAPSVPINQTVHSGPLSQPDIQQSLESISPHSNAPNTMPPASPSASIASNNNINFLLNPSTSLSPPIDPSLHSPRIAGESSFTQRVLLPGSSSDINVSETDHEIAFLLRHYSESPGQW